ncbi:MAG: NnrU family protein [Pseudomonadota bacterium]
MKRLTQHPMLWGVLIWSASHLLNNADGASVLLFGAFLVWAAVDLVSCYRRPRANPHATGAGPRTHWWPDVASLVLALVVTVALVSFLHEWAFGVAIA